MANTRRHQAPREGQNQVRVRRVESERRTSGWSNSVNESESSQEVTHERSAKRESITPQQILRSETPARHQLNASMAHEVHPRSLCGLACGPHGTSKHRHTTPHGTGGEGILGRSERAKRLCLLVCGNVPTFGLTWLMVILTARWITPCEERSKRGRGERTRREDEPSRRVSQVAKRDESGSFWCALSLEEETQRTLKCWHIFSSLT
jgi:hypothetical protein